MCKKHGKYTFNRFTHDYENPGSFKIAKKKIAGHYRKALFQYTPSGYVIVLTKAKYHHDYSFSQSSVNEAKKEVLQYPSVVLRNLFSYTL